MLLNKTELLVKELNAFKLLQSASSESQDYIKRNTDLRNIVIYTEQMARVVLLFREEGFIVELDAIIKYPLELFNTLYRNWENNTKVIIERNDFFTKRVPWDIIQRDLTTILHQQWEEYIDKSKPNINRETLDAFEQIPDFSQVVSSLKEKLELLEEYKTNLPSDSDKFKLVLSTAEDMKNLTERLDSKNIPDSVKSFLNKAGNTGVDLSEITVEILNWLKENKLIHLCQVKFKK